MAEQQQVQGVPEGVTEQTPVQGVPEGVTAEALPSPKQNVQGVPEGLTEEPLASSKITASKSTPKPPYAGVTVPKKTVPVAPEESLLTQLDKSPAITQQQDMVVKAARGVRGLYHGLVGDEESTEAKGTPSGEHWYDPNSPSGVKNMGVTPENMGYKAGEMLHGVGKFTKEAVQDIAGNEPIVIPNKGDKSFDDPKAHTLVAKYVTAPSMAERQASQDEMQKYFETKGPAAAGHAISAFLHGTLGEYVPAIGPLAMSLEDQAQKGDIGGALAQIASLYATEKGTGAIKEGIVDRANAKVKELTKTPEVKQAEANVESTKKPLADAQAKYDTAAAEHMKYSASHAQGIDSPKAVRSAIDKAQTELDEAQAHHDLAKEHLENTQAAQKTLPQRAGEAAGQVAAKVLPTPKTAEVPTEQVEAAPALKQLGAPKPVKPALPAINVKTPGQVQPETFPQEPKPLPRSPLGRIDLANNQGTVGKPLQLTEGTPEGPKIPVGGLPKLKVPEAPKVEALKSTTDEAALRALSVKEGNVIETPEKKVHRLLQEALKPEAPKAKEPAAETKAPDETEKRKSTDRRQEEVPVEEERRVGSRRNAAGIRVDENGDPELSPDIHGHWQSGVFGEKPVEDVGSKARQANPEPTRAETKAAALPKEEHTQYSAKNEEIIPAGAEGREPVKSASEYHPAVEQKVSELSDDNLKKLAKAHGLNPDEYDFKARDERRHRVERDQLAKDITEQLGEDEKINLGRAAERVEKEGTFANKDQSAKGRADRAEKLFPRLRGPVDTYGNPKVSGGSQGATEPTTVGGSATVETAKSDNEHFANAKKELGEKASISDVAKRAQEMKDEAAKPSLKKTVNEYAKSEGLGEVKDNKLDVDPSRKEISKAYDDMKHDPSDPEVKKSYAALIDDAKKQWNALEKSGIKIEPQDEDPYKSYDEMKKDFEDNKRLKVFRGGNELPEDHPLSKIDPKTGETYNVMFRAVHDAIGHLTHDNDFSEKGEENAYDTHRQTMSKEAIPAMTTETKGQVSSYFDKGEFPEQKAGILPDEFSKGEEKPQFKTTNRHAEDLTYEHKPEGLEKSNQQHRVTTLDENGKKIGEVSAQDTAKGEVTVRSDQVYDKNMRGAGRGYDQIKHLLDRVSENQDIHTIHSDISNSTPEKGVWDKLMADYPDAITKKDFKDGQVQYTVDTDAYAKASVPSVSGASGKLPTGDELIKKYGESSGDPKDLTFILKDGRGVKNTGSIHDEMLGGKATDKNPPRERFIAEGNIRVRPHQGKAGREVAFSIPESGVSSDQLKYLQKMSPQLKSGAVAIEVGKPGGSYKSIPYGEATPEAIEKAVRDLGPVLNDKGSPTDVNGNPTVSGGSQAAGTGKAKTGALPKLAEEHLTEEEKAGVTKTDAGRKTFVDNLKKLPSVQEFTDIAKAGEGGRKWYQRSAAAFDALAEEAPKYFKDGDRQKFTDFLAALSPQQSVKMNLGEALNTWTKYVDEGRPSGKELEKLLRDELTLSGAKIPNATKALAGEPLWPDLSKNANFKVPSFAKNLNGYLNHVTNDGWQALFGGLDAKAIAKANAYHPLAVVTRAAADALGWEPAEAQAAIWAFTKTFTEKGETLPEDVRRRSEDFADILAMDPEIRQQLAQLGVNHEQLDAKLRAIGKKPQVTPGASPTTENSIGKLAKRIEGARGKGTIPPPKSGNLNFNDEDEATGFNPSDFENEESSLGKLGDKKKKSPLGSIR